MDGLASSDVIILSSPYPKFPFHRVLNAWRVHEHVAGVNLLLIGEAREKNCENNPSVTVCCVALVLCCFKKKQEKKKLSFCKNGSRAQSKAYIFEFGAAIPPVAVGTASHPYIFIFSSLRFQPK